jgi:hypothetical protein
MKKLHILALATVALLAAPVASFANHWTAVPSTGAIDEADLSLYQVNGATLFFASGKTGDIFARYNVTNTSTSATSPGWTTLELGYTDTSVSGFVEAIFYEVDPCTGTRSVICSVFSSDDGTACNTCTFPSTTVNFAANLYFVTIVVNRSTTAASPIANTVRLF